MAVIDVCTFNGEYDLLEVRLSILDDYVDQFIICEAETTFSGLPKSLYYPIHSLRYKKFWPKIKYFVLPSSYSQEEIEVAMTSPATQFGKSHWVNEFLQKESIKRALIDLKDDDICIVGDCDEIWDKSALQLDYGAKLRLRVYTYWMNNHSNEEFSGPLFTTYKVIKDNCLNNLRNYAHKTPEYFGWHFTSLGGYEEVKRKLTDGYTKETYANDEVMNALEYNVIHNNDFLGRNFSYIIDETEWPIYLIENRQKYKHLLK